MEDKYLCMKYENNHLPNIVLEKGQQILIGDYKDPVRKGFVAEKKIGDDNRMQVILPIKSVINERYMVNEDGIIEERHPYCQHCNSHHFVRKGL